MSSNYQVRLNDGACQQCMDAGPSSRLTIVLTPAFPCPSGSCYLLNEDGSLKRYGYDQMHRMVAEATFPTFNMMFEQDRLGRMRGEKPMVLPIVAAEDGMPCALPGKEAWEFARPWFEKKPEDNEVTVRS